MLEQVGVYKPFGFGGLLEDEISDFSLMPITEVYLDINNGKEVYFLNALNEPVKVKSITKEEQEFDYDRDMYKIILEDGTDLLVSEKHRVYAGKRESIVNLSSYNVMNLPSKSPGFVSFNNLENDSSNASGLSCGILNQTIENILSLVNLSRSVKSESLVINTLCSDFENSASLPFESSLGFETTSNPCCLRNTSNLLLTFSSLRNLSSEGDTELDIVSTSCQICCILQSCFDVLFSQRGVILENFIYTNSSFKHFQDLPDHDSCALESWLSMTDFSICNNILVDFDSHWGDGNDNDVFKFFDSLSDFGLMPITDVYSSVNDGKEVYFLNALNEPVKVLSIAKEPYSGKIYDVDIGNDIVLVRRKSAPEFDYNNDMYRIILEDGSEG